MPKTTAIICTLQELPDYASPDGSSRLFTLNLSTALIGVPATLDASEANLLMPWRWDSLDGIKVWLGGIAAPTFVDATLTPQPTLAPAPFTAPLEAALLTDAPAGRASWNPADPGANASQHDEIQQKTWQDTLAHVSASWPAPVPQRLRLTLYFTLSNLPADPVLNLLAAPAFHCNGKAHVPAVNAPTAIPMTDRSLGDTFQWQYDSDTSAYATPYTALPAAASLPAAEAPLWINVAWNQSGENWRSSLAQRAASLADLAQLSLDVLREKFSDEPLNKDALKSLKTSVVGLLYDIAGSALRFAPDGASLHRFIVEYVAPHLVAPATGEPFDLANWMVWANRWLIVADGAVTASGWMDYLHKLLSAEPALNDKPSPVTVEGLVTQLDHLQSTLCDESTLAGLIFAQWDKALTAAGAGPDTYNWWSQQLRALVQARLNDLAAGQLLRARLLQSILGGSTTALTTWRAITKDNNIAANLGHTLAGYFDARWNGGGTADFKEMKPVLDTGALPLGFLARFTTQAKTIITTRATDLAKVYGATTLTPQPHPVHLTVLADNASDEILRAVAGVGILARQKGMTAWRCLNAASLSTTTNIALADAVFVPYGIAEHSGVLQTEVSYNSQPLIAASPIAVASHDIPMFPPRDDDSAIFQYHPLRATAATPDTDVNLWGRIPSLKFGRDYEFAAFFIRNGGALPRSLAGATPYLPLTPRGIQPPAGHSASVQYRRRVPLGTVRFFDQTGKIDLAQQNLPPFPATVEPRAQALLLALDPPTDITEINDKRPPLLLLWQSTEPGHDTFSFNVRPPATTASTWDRWVSWDDDACVPKPDPATPSLFNTRVTVLSSETFHAPKRASDDGRDIGAQPRSAGIDTTINDPAVAGTLLTLTPVGPVSSQPPYPTAFAPVPPPKGIPKTTGQPYNDLKGLQGGVCTLKVVLVEADKPAGISPPDATGSMTISVPKGEVWKLSITPAITPDAKDRFESFLTTGKGQLAGAESNGYIASSDAFDLLIEAASPINLSSQSLWSALSTEQKGGKLNFCLNPNASDKDKSWHLIRRVEVTRQVWRWSGRPFSSDIPIAGPKVINRLIPGTTEPGPQMTTALNWEAEAFADRETDGLLSQSIAEFGPQQLSAGWSPSQLLSLDLSGDRRAQYFRFTARAFSRYEGLPGFTAFTETSSDSLAANQPLTISRKANGATPWVRHFWPATIAPGDIPAKPNLLLAIPLTRSKQVKDSADPTKLKLPGLLVILDEPWFQVAGLAECLRMSIDIAHGKQRQRPQLGPDPIFTPIPDTPLPTPGVTPLTGDPMGLTFDESNTASLFRNTCFYFDLDPLAKAAALDTLDWYMAKVNLTRVIQGSQLNPPSATDIESQPTESTWVQFLPNGSTITTQDNKLVRCDAISFAAQNDGSLQFTPAIKPGPSSAQPIAHLEFWALVMHDVTDASGSTSEAYVGLFRPDKHGALRPFNGVAIELSEAGGTHLYLLEVQVSPRFQADPAPSWITQLFPTADGEQTQDATHRILRISDRINHNPSKNHTAGAGK